MAQRNPKDELDITFSILLFIIFLIVDFFFLAVLVQAKKQLTVSHAIFFVMIIGYSMICVLIPDSIVPKKGNFEVWSRKEGRSIPCSRETYLWRTSFWGQVYFTFFGVFGFVIGGLLLAVPGFALSSILLTMISKSASSVEKTS